MINSINISLPVSNQPIQSSTSASTAYSPRLAVLTPWDTVASLVQRRVKMLTYLKNVYAGKSLYFNLTRIQQEDILNYVGPDNAKRRAANYLRLGVSLADLLHMVSSTAFLKSINVLIQEYEYHNSDMQGQKFAARLKKKKPVKDEQSSYNVQSNIQETGKYTFLNTLHIPFDLDYIEVLQSLIEVLCEVYSKFLQWKPKNATVISPSTEKSPVADQSAVSDEVAFAEAVLRLDGRFYKLINLNMKELDEISNALIKKALGEIDPLAESKKAVDDSIFDELEFTERTATTDDTN